MAENIAINYEDQRFQQVEADKKAALSDLEQTYAGMAETAKEGFKAQIDAAREWGETQQKNQQAQTDFAIEKIEQQKEQARKDYVKEQSGAYTDWQKESNEYGTNAEREAAMGMAGTGFSESAQVSMYNTYQNRVSVARKSYDQAVLNYNNAIAEARLQNNAALAEIAFQTLESELNLSLQGLQYENQLLLDEADKKMVIDEAYYNRWKNVEEQMTNEHAMNESIRQYNQNFDLQTKEYNEGVRQFNEELERALANDQESVRQFNEELKRAQANDAEDKRRWEEEMAESQRQFELRYGGSEGSGGSGGSGGAGGAGGSTEGMIRKSGADEDEEEIVITMTAIKDIARAGYKPSSADDVADLVEQGKIELYADGSGTIRARKKGTTKTNTGGGGSGGNRNETR